MTEENESLQFLRRLADGTDEEMMDPDLRDESAVEAPDQLRERVRAELTMLRAAQKRVIELNERPAIGSEPVKIPRALKQLDQSLERWSMGCRNALPAIPLDIADSLLKNPAYEAIIRNKFRRCLGCGRVDRAQLLARLNEGKPDFDGDIVDMMLDNLSHGKVRQATDILNHYGRHLDFRCATGYAEAVALGFKRRLLRWDLAGALTLKDTFAAGLDLPALLGGEKALHQLFRELLKIKAAKEANAIYEMAGQPAEFKKTAKNSYFSKISSDEYSDLEEMANIFKGMIDLDSEENQSLLLEARKRGFLAGVKSCRSLDQVRRIHQKYKIDFDYSEVPGAQDSLLDVYIYILIFQGQEAANQFKKEFAEGIDLLTAPKYEQIVREHFIRHLRFSQTPKHASFIMAELGKGFDFSEEIKQVVQELFETKPNRIETIKIFFPNAIGWSAMQRTKKTKKY